jgi:hypothetical protein
VPIPNGQRPLLPIVLRLSHRHQPCPSQNGRLTIFFVLFPGVVRERRSIVPAFYIDHLNIQACLWGRTFTYIRKVESFYICTACTMTRPSGFLLTVVLLIAPLLAATELDHDRRTFSKISTVSVASIGSATATITQHVDLKHEQPASTSSSTSTSHIPTPLYLPVTTAAPDPLGMAKVSGVYGPGAWAAWYMTLVSSWWRIGWRSKEKFDPNTWAFLFGVQYASVDLLRCVCNVRTAASPEQAKARAGQYGAAYMVAFWGLWHAVWQILATLVIYSVSDELKCRNRRLLTLGAGIVLPSIALQAAGFQARFFEISNIPALYMQGEDVTGRGLWLFMESSFLISPFPLLMCVAYLPVIADIRPGAFAVMKGFRKTINNNVYVGSLLLLIFLSWPISLVCYLLVPEIRHDGLIGPVWLTAPMVFISSLFLWAIFPLAWVIIIIEFSVIHVYKGYLTRQLDSSQSCFFMPCAPQSLGDSDQMYSLLFGVLSFFFDVLSSLYKWIKKRYEDKAFVGHMSSRFTEHVLRRNDPGTEA